jgi:hypothetical protein
MFIDSTEQILPLASDLYVRPVHAPGGCPIALIPSGPLLQLRRVAMDPAHDRQRGHLDTAFLHHLHEIPIADAVLAVPANTKQDDLNGEAPTLEHDPSYRLEPMRPSHPLLMQQGPFCNPGH